jgi:hypothetical protein
MKTKTTAKVLHHESSHYKGFHLSLKAIERKIEKGATMRHFLPKENGTHSFISLRTKGDRVQKTYYFDPCEQLLALPHEVVQQ